MISHHYVYCCPDNQIIFHAARPFLYIVAAWRNKMSVLQRQIFGYHHYAVLCHNAVVFLMLLNSLIITMSKVLEMLYAVQGIL